MLDLLTAFGLSHLYNETPVPCCASDRVSIRAITTLAPRLDHKDAA